MTSHAIRHSEATALRRCTAFIYAVAQNLAAAACSLDTWLESRRRASAIRRALGEMTDRELRDIGLTRFDIEAVARSNPPRASY